MPARSLRRCAIATLLLNLTVACAAPADSRTPTPTSGLALEPCHLSAPGLTDRLPAECGTLAVYENRAAQSGRQITLRVAVLKANSRKPAPDPLFFFNVPPPPYIPQTAWPTA